MKSDDEVPAKKTSPRSEGEPPPRKPRRANPWKNPVVIAAIVAACAALLASPQWVKNLPWQPRELSEVQRQALQEWNDTTVRIESAVWMFVREWSPEYKRRVKKGEDPAAIKAEMEIQLREVLHSADKVKALKANELLRDAFPDLKIDNKSLTALLAERREEFAKVRAALFQAVTESKNPATDPLLKKALEEYRLSRLQFADRVRANSKR